MKNKIKWLKFHAYAPAKLDEWYLVKQGDNVYIDKWVHEDYWIGPENLHIVKNTWETSSDGYVDEWTFIDGISLREYIEMSMNQN